ncbi:hypothetical protein, partial [Klebsiella pneumoniae]|uniref:hypothetical protein n=1 Tax=Klebsiella pneumoniae TaxID=573 RepID=UPI001953B534
MTTVEAFYRALEVANGEEAARMVVPVKRRSGPLSAAALGRFYGSLSQPLRLIDVVVTGRDQYRARYT